MRDFLTVEDVNTVSYANQGFYWHEIDTGNISEEDFDWTTYDFCEVKRETINEMYYYSFKIHHSFWTLGYHTLDKNGNTFSNNDQYQEGILTIFCAVSHPSGDFSAIKLYLYIGRVGFESETYIALYLLNESISLNYKELNTTQSVKYKRWSDEPSRPPRSVSKDLNIGFNLIENEIPQTAGYLLVNLLKTDFVFNCTQSLIVGKVNKVYLGTDSDYKPNGALVGEYTPNITVTYNGETLPVQYDETDYYFNLDLTDKTETGKIRFKVNVEANEVLNSTSTDVALNSQYQTVNTFDALLSAVSISDVIRLGANMTATSNIPVNRSVKIIGNDKTFDLDGYQFKLNDGVEFKAENLQLNNGDTTIIQAPNTSVELTGVTFTNCTSSDYNNLGSCIFCDSEAENIDITDDFNTILTDCQFINNHNAILHGGQLDINRCKFHNTDTSYVDIYNPAFIYQTDGECTILNSVFDIDYGTDYSLCTGEQSIGFSQCIFMCGTTATINGVSYTELKGNNFNTFFDNPQNNRAHIYAKYYYPQIETCVFSSPTSGNEDKALCYGLGGDDMIHKINCQVTRADSGNENTTRRISW